MKFLGVSLCKAPPCWRPPQVNVLLIGFFNYYYTFLQLEPKELADQLKRQVPATLHRCFAWRLSQF